MAQYFHKTLDLGGSPVHIIADEYGNRMMLEIECGDSRQSVMLNAADMEILGLAIVVSARQRQEDLKR